MPHEVLLREQKLKDAKTQEPVPSLNWEIVLNGQFVGFVPMANPQTVLCLRLDETEISAVMRAVRIKFHPRQVPEPLQPPEPPRPQPDAAEYVDPFESFAE